ncbi:hypothetical protein ACFQZ4_11585 [Catellatospora coxensis]
MYDNRFGDQSYLDWLALNPYEGLAQRVRVLAGTAAVLDDLHSGRRTGVPVAHGDVKPATVVVRPDGSSSPADLGELWTVDGSLVAARSTPYAAPELFLPGALTSPDADRYAFVATVVHAVLGTPPPVHPGPRPAGGIDLFRLAEQLRAHPLSAAFPAFQHRLLNALSAAPSGRVHTLTTWLDALLNDLAPPMFATTGTLPLAPGRTRRPPRRCRPGRRPRRRPAPAARRRSPGCSPGWPPWWRSRSSPVARGI